MDEYIVDVSSGSNLTKYPSVVFKIFIDGKLAAASPVMRILEQSWRFDVKIPRGSGRISAVATDAGDGNCEDLVKSLIGDATGTGGLVTLSPALSLLLF